MGITFQNNTKIDVNALFGIEPLPLVKPTAPSVADLAAEKARKDLGIVTSLNAQTYGQATGPTPSYASWISSHGSALSVARSNLVASLQAYNHSIGAKQETAIAALDNPFVTTPEVLRQLPVIATATQRDTLVNARDHAQEMAKQADELWGSSDQNNRELRTHFEEVAEKLSSAITQFDSGDATAAIDTYRRATWDNDAHMAWLGRDLRHSEGLKNGTRIGIVAVAAAVATVLTDGAALAVLGEAGVASLSGGAQLGLMLANGAAFITAERVIEHQIFHEPILRKTGLAANTLDLTTDIGTTSVLFRWLRFVGEGAPIVLPIAKTEPALAVLRNFGAEYGALSAFGVTTGVDPRLLGTADYHFDQLSFLLGLKLSNGILRVAKFTGQQSARSLARARDHFYDKINTPRVAQFLLSPMAIMGGIPGNGRPGTPIGNAFTELLKTLGARPNLVDIYQRRPYKFWGILNLLDMGLPPALVAYRILRLQVDNYSQSLMTEFGAILQSPQVKQRLTQIREHGMQMCLEISGVPMDSEKVRNGANLMDQLARAYSQMQWYVDTHGHAAAKAGHMVGMEYEGMTRFGAYEEVVWPDDRPIPLAPHPDGPSVRDRMAITLRHELTQKGYDVQLAQGESHFGYSASPILFPTIYERFRHNGRVVKVEILTGTGAVIVTVVPEIDPTHSKTEHVKGAKTVFEPDVEAKVAEMVAKALKLNIMDESPEDAIAILRKTPGSHDRRYLMLAKDKLNDILKIWVTFNADGTATLSPINGILKNASGDYTAGQTISIPAITYKDVETWMSKIASNDIAFAKKTDLYKGVVVKGLGMVLLTDEAHPYKEIVSPKLTQQNFAAWLDVVDILGKMGITGTTPYNQVGTHIHGNLPVMLETSPNPKFTILPVLGILRGFAADMETLYDGIPSHSNRLGFIQRMPLWLKERLLDPTYVTDPTDRRQILRVAADLARDVKKYNALNVSNHVSAFLAEMIRSGLFKDGETISDHWNGEDYHYRVSAGSLSEAHDIIREIHCASFVLNMQGSAFAITRSHFTEGLVNDRSIQFFRNSLYNFRDDGNFFSLQVGNSLQRRDKSPAGDEYQFIVTRTEGDTVTVEVKQQVHLMRVATDARKTTAELRIFDALFDKAAGKFFLDFYHAWSWWHGSGQFLNQPQPPSAPSFIEGGNAVFAGPSRDRHIPESTD